MCHPYWPYDLETEQKLHILEIPLAVMDGAMFKNMGLNTESARRLLEKLVLEIEGCGGTLTLLWHNTYHRGSRGRLYDHILRFAADRGALLTNAGELHDHWQANNILGGG